MKYLTGIYGLNIGQAETCGDWHRLALNWSNAEFLESNGSFFGDYRIQAGRKIPQHEGTHYVADHIRCCLDMIYQQRFSLVTGMRHDFICNEKFTVEIFLQVREMQSLPYWGAIYDFMLLEYGFDWAIFIKKGLVKPYADK